MDEGIALGKRLALTCFFMIGAYGYRMVGIGLYSVGSGLFRVDTRLRRYDRIGSGHLSPRVIAACAGTTKLCQCRVPR